MYVLPIQKVKLKKKQAQLKVMCDAGLDPILDENAIKDIRINSKIGI